VSFERPLIPAHGWWHQPRNPLPFLLFRPEMWHFSFRDYVTSQIHPKLDPLSLLLTNLCCATSPMTHPNLCCVTSLIRPSGGLVTFLTNLCRLDQGSNFRRSGLDKLFRLKQKIKIIRKYLCKEELRFHSNSKWHSKAGMHNIWPAKAFNLTRDTKYTILGYIFSEQNLILILLEVKSLWQQD